MNWSLHVILGLFVRMMIPFCFCFLKKTSLLVVTSSYVHSVGAWLINARPPFLKSHDSCDFSYDCSLSVFFFFYLCSVWSFGPFQSQFLRTFLITGLNFCMYIYLRSCKAVFLRLSHCLSFFKTLRRHILVFVKCSCSQLQSP